MSNSTLEERARELCRAVEGWFGPIPEAKRPQHTNPCGWCETFKAFARKEKRLERERCRLASCQYCRLGWPMLGSIAIPHERHTHPADYKGMRAGAGPNCGAAAIRALGCNQNAFARHCRITPPHLSRMCQGFRNVPYWLDLLIAEWSGRPNPPPISERLYVNRPRHLRNPQDAA